MKIFERDDGTMGLRDGKYRPVVPQSHRPFVLSSLLFLFLAAFARAGVVEAWVEVSNTRPYVGEAFTFTLRAAVTPGSDLTGESIHGLDRYPLALGTLRKTGRAAGEGGNEVVSYSGVFRATAPFASRLELVFAGNNSEQRRNGFFTQWTGSPFRLQARPIEFAARALPTEGRPPDFSGAVGTFSLDVQSTPREVHVNDLVAREIRLRGAPDNLAGTLMPFVPGLGENFKAYDLNEMSRAENPPEVTLRQQLIPLNTNAVEIASPSFTFFDPKAGVYRTLQPAPEKLVFLAGDAVAPDAGTRVLDFEQPASNETKTMLPSKLALPLLRDAGGRVEIARHAQARLAPSSKAVVLFELEPGASVMVAERAEGWLRVVSRGRAGWIQSEAVGEQP